MSGTPASQTFLRHFAACPHSAYLYREHRDDAAASLELARGSALHSVLERAIGLMVEQGEPTIPPELVKAIVNEVLAEQPVPWREQDYLRECAYRWASDFACDPRQVLGVEQMVALDIGGYEVRCKLDLIEARDAGSTVLIADWKSSLAPPAFEDIARRRSDGTLAPKQFQLVLYALAAAYGVPVHVAGSRCPACNGTTWFGEDAGGDPCPECEGTGTLRKEIREPFPLAPRAERFELELVYPGRETREGRMVRRPVILTRLELAEYREGLFSLLEQLAASEREGFWPAIQSDEACGECPASRLCPIPRDLQRYAGHINTYDEAVEAAERWDRETARLAAVKRELRALAKSKGWEIRYGRNKAMRFVYGESDRIDDKEAMFEAIRRAVEYGEPFDPTVYVRTVGSSNFKVVKLSEDELVDESREAA